MYLSIKTIYINVYNNINRVMDSINNEIYETKNFVSKINIEIDKLYKKYELNDVFEYSTNINHILLNILLTKISIKELFKIQHNIVLIINLVKSIYHSLLNDSLKENLIIINVSKNIYKHYKKYKNNSKIFIDNKFNIINDIKPNEYIHKVDEMTKYIKKYPHAIELYIYIIQKYMNTCNFDICQHIINCVENIKDYFLINDATEYNEKTIYKKNVYLSSFGLMSCSKVHELDDILNIMLKIKIKTSNLENIANNNTICIIVFNTNNNNNIFYNIHDINKTLQNKLYNINDGITLSMIYGFNIIQKIKNKKKSRWNFSIDYYGNIDSDYFLILQKLNDSNYSALSLIYDLYNFETYKKIHKTEISSLINFIKNKGIYPIHTRKTEYNNILEKTILKNMFSCNKLDINKINSKIDINLLRHEIVVKIIQSLMSTIKKRNKPITNKYISKIIHNKCIFNIFNISILEQINKYIDTRLYNNNISEIIHTFLYTVYNLSIDFNRIIHDTYLKSELHANIVLPINMVNLNKIQNILTDIITTTINKIILDDDNIYYLLYKKDMIFNNIIF